ncbi:MAG: sulfite exporter TauE/SafE family protein [Burkholderiales bacterium]|nr:sulfite exporter TauE/SafE family protein [Pseudomonadota bacterium]MCC7067550.1 sulfite exporter TauE/SafE family protein [Burkholderiales bacterium]MCZ2136410.1 sulfite exporter TauE/SafE family protein [Burkholderiales bacterium]
MEYLNVWFLAYIALGVLVGFLAGLLGIGGGMTMVPILAILFPAQGFPFETKMQVILATSMATIIFTSLSSVRAHHARGAVDWRVLWTMAPGILLGSMVGTRIVAMLSTLFLAVFFTCFLFYTGTQMLLNFKPKAHRTLPGTAGLFAAGILVGFLSAMVGAGGGFFSVPFLLWCNVSAHTAIGTSAALGFPIAVFTTIGNIVNGWNVPNVPQPALGYIYLPALVGISAASVVVAPYGARLSHKLPVATLKRIFAVLLYVLGLRMLWGVLMQ